MNQFEKALDLAYHTHKHQYRKSNGIAKIPYIIHPLEVVKKLSKWGITDNAILIPALLHDTIEDTHKENREKLAEEIKTTFGDDTLNIVQELTCIGGDKATYMESFKTKSESALIIKIADRICNVEDFMIDNMKYAPKYLLRANPLIAHFFSLDDTTYPKARQEIIMLYSNLKIFLPLDGLNPR